MSSYNQGNGLQFRAQLDVPATTEVFQQQLKEIADKLTVTISNVKFDDKALSSITSQLQDIQKQVAKFGESVSLTPKVDTTQISKSVDEISKLTTDGMKVVQSYIDSAMKEFGVTADKIKTQFMFDPNTGQIQQFILNIQKAQGELEKLKYIADQSSTLQVGENRVVTQAFNLAPQATLTDNTSATQAKAIEDELNNYKKLSDNNYASWWKEQLAQQEEQAKQEAQREQQIQDEINSYKKLSDSNYVSWWKEQLAQQESDYSAYEDAISQKIKLIETFNDLNITSNEEAFAQLKQLYTENSQYFAQNIDKNIAMLQKLNDAEIAANAPEKSMSSGSGSRGLTGAGNMSHSGFGLSPLNMGLTVAQFQLEITLIENIKKGFVELQQGSAGLQQVFGETIKNQSQLNDVTNQFVAVAQKYGASVDDVVTSAKLWGRQYKDVETALTLTNNATLLSIVDNLSVADSNKAVESSMNAMGESVQNAGQAYNDSMKLVDSWSAVSHQASVSAQDLTQGFERSAAAAHNAGINVDQLSALVAAGVRNTGKLLPPMLVMA